MQIENGYALKYDVLWRWSAGAWGIAAISVLAIQAVLLLPAEQIASPAAVFILLNLALSSGFAFFAAHRNIGDSSLKLALRISSIGAALLLAGWVSDWSAEYDTFQDTMLATAWLLSAAATFFILHRQEIVPMVRNLLLFAIVAQGVTIALDYFDEFELVASFAGSWLDYTYMGTGIIAATTYQLGFMSLAMTEPVSQKKLLLRLSPPSSRWPRRKIERMLAREQFGYQRIELPYGLATAGKDRIATLEKVFPANLNGKSLLDVGCNHGYFCFSAKRLGAGRVVGCDVKPSIVRRAQMLSACMDTDVTFEVRNIDTDMPGGTFDYVLCLNLLHHLHDPIAAIDRLVAITDERLVLEIAGLNLFDYVKRLHTVPLMAFVNALSPVIFIGKMKNPLGSNAAFSLKYYITRRALLRMLEQYGSQFARVQCVRSGYKGRYLIICDKHPK